MKYFSTAMLMVVMATARVSRPNLKARITEMDDINLDMDRVVGRIGIPSGLIATDDIADQAIKFLKWAAQYGKSFKDKQEKDMREGIWRKNNQMIRLNNLKSEASYNPDAPYMDHN